MIVFTNNELKDMAINPEVLRALADYHKTQLTMADSLEGMGDVVSHHEKRKKELLKEADNIEAKY